MMHKVYVTRDASVTYVAEVDLSVEEIEKRCGKYGFDTDGLHEVVWELDDVSSYDNAEAYHITHEEGEEEVSDKQWDLS